MNPIAWEWHFAWHMRLSSKYVTLNASIHRPMLVSAGTRHSCQLAISFTHELVQ